MAFCRYCGKEINEHQKYCAYCGGEQVVSNVNVKQEEVPVETDKFNKYVVELCNN